MSIWCLNISASFFLMNLLIVIVLQEWPGPRTTTSLPWRLKTLCPAEFYLMEKLEQSAFKFSPSASHPSTNNAAFKGLNEVECCVLTYNPAWYILLALFGLPCHKEPAASMLANSSAVGELAVPHILTKGVSCTASGLTSPWQLFLSFFLKLGWRAREKFIYLFIF